MSAVPPFLPLPLPRGGTMQAKTADQWATMELVSSEGVPMVGVALMVGVVSATVACMDEQQLAKHIGQLMNRQAKLSKQTAAWRLTQGVKKDG